MLTKNMAYSSMGAISVDWSVRCVWLENREIPFQPRDQTTQSCLNSLVVLKFLNMPLAAMGQGVAYSQVFK